MEIEKLTGFPEELKHHTLTDQELSVMTVGQQALAKDWNILNRKMTWIAEEVVFLHNVISDHDKKLETWSAFRKVGAVMVTLGGAVWIAIQIYSFFTGHQVKP